MNFLERILRRAFLTFTVAVRTETENVSYCDKRRGGKRRADVEDGEGRGREKGGGRQIKQSQNVFVIDRQQRKWRTVI